MSPPTPKKRSTDRFCKVIAVMIHKGGGGIELGEKMVQNMQIQCWQIYQNIIDPSSIEISMFLDDSRETPIFFFFYEFYHYLLEFRSVHLKTYGNFTEL